MLCNWLWFKVRRPFFRLWLVFLKQLQIAEKMQAGSATKCSDRIFSPLTFGSKKDRIKQSLIQNDRQKIHLHYPAAARD
jgi:hypothetical protein